MLKAIISVLLTVCISLSVAVAGELGFETTKEGIVRGLTRPLPNQTVQIRSFTVPNTALRSMRSIIVVEKKEGKEIKEEVWLTSDPPAASVNLKILFDYDSYQIRANSYGLLNELGKAVTSDALRNRQIIIKGHTDSDGHEMYNLKLSLNRAIAVRNYLIGNFFIEDEKLRVQGFGEAVPLVSNTTNRNKQLNRRVEIQAE